MNKIIFTFLLLLFSAKTCFTQNISGTRLTSMGNTNVAVKDNWNFTGNFNDDPEKNKPIIAIGFAKYFYGNDLSNQNLKFIVPIKNYELGINFQRYGISEFNEITAGASVAKNFGNQFSIGLRANYHQLKIQNYGSTVNFTIDAGVMYNYNNEITIGLNITNLAKQNYNNTNASVYIPSSLNFGAAYQISNKVLIATSLNKVSQLKYDVSFGLDYQLIEPISLRGGITMKPFKQYGGVGIEHKKMNLDFAITSDPNLGYSSQIGITYAF